MELAVSDLPGCWPKGRRVKIATFPLGELGGTDCVVVDEEVGYLRCGGETKDISRSIRIYVGFKRCKTYHTTFVYDRLDGGFIFPLFPWVLSPCPVLVLEGRAFAPVLNYADKSVELYVEMRRRPPRAWNHLWHPLVAVGRRPGRLGDYDYVYFPDGPKPKAAWGLYPVDYAGPLARLYGVDRPVYITEEFRVPGAGKHLGERFAVYYVKDDYLQIETPWGLDFALNFVLGTVGDRWVLMGKDGLYEAVFRPAEGAGGKVGYVKVVGPYGGDVGLVEGPPALGEFLPSECGYWSPLTGRCYADPRLDVVKKWPLETVDASEYLHLLEEILAPR